MSKEIENNRLIAEFMGMKHLNTKIDSHNFEQYTYSMPDELSKQVYGYTGAECFLEDQFSNSWDWLMPVVEKIESEHTDCEIVIYSSSCYISKWNAEKEKYDSFISGVGKKIEAVYDAVIQFIKWYNENKQP